MTDARWTAIVPIRSWSHGKTRLGAPGTRREDLARAFGLDVLDAVRACPEVRRVVLVTSDPDVVQDVSGPGVVIEPDPGAGLVAAVEAGARLASASGAERWVVVPADLPSLTSAVLAEVLRLAGDRPLCCVDDADGDGTTLLLHQGGAPTRAAYGPGSAAAHRALGAHPLTDVPAAARRDVDTPGHLDEALRLGVGPRTAAVATRRAAAEAGG